LPKGTIFMSQDDTEIASRRTVQLEFYDTPTLIFHWLTVLFVLALFGTSLVWNYLTPHNRYWRPLLEGIHVSLGIVFAVLIVGRVLWRLTGSRRLPVEAGISGVFSRAMYLTLYGLLAGEVVLGFALRWLQGEEFLFFGLFSVPALLEPEQDLAHVFEDLHDWVGWAIVILAAGHAVAALIHHYVLKDKVMDRMLYRRRDAMLGTKQ
jgi:cytochrome b561